VPRPALHDTDVLLDAVRDLIVEAGPRAAGIRAIAQRSGAPSGSLYHRFGSRDGLVAHSWLRAVRRFQVGFLAALDADDPRDGVADAVRWGVSFALDHPADARLLWTYRRQDLLDAEPVGAVAAALSAINEPLVRAIEVLAARLYGTGTAEARERVWYAIIDLPLAVLRRHLRTRTLVPATADSLAAAARALVSHPPPPKRARPVRRRRPRGDR
jgi:AcrR family transcriptional regulator